MQIQFYFSNITATLPERKRLKLFIEGIFKKNSKKLNTLVIIFCSDDYLLDINKQFLEHDYYTDIITFNLSEDINIIDGELYISIDRVKDNSFTNKVSFMQELHRVIFHGVLHLCGFTDKSIRNKKAMTFQEDDCLEKYFDNNQY